jgi:exopolyphosphatase/guanosine-5'-triphosphate,3'-diphosphate pyrophosphatase
MRVGAIDVGSNSIRLLVADVGQGPGGEARIETVARAGEACRLARGLHHSGRIDPEIAGRAAEIVTDFARRARTLGAVRVVLAATAAVRSAANGPEVVADIEGRSGLALRVLTGEDEARLVYRAVVGGLGGGARRSSCLVFDIGGGSTEVVSGVGEQAGRWTSLPFGAVSLSERFLHADPPDPAHVAALREHVASVIMHECAYMPDRTPLLAGVGGTVTLLAAMDRGISTYDPMVLEGHHIPAERLAGWVERLVHSTHAERLGFPLMGEGRADIVVAGALVVAELARRFPSAALVCSTQGLRYGLVRLAADEATESQAP